MELSLMKRHSPDIWGKFDNLFEGFFEGSKIKSPQFRYDDEAYIADFELAGVNREEVKVYRQGLDLAVEWTSRLGELKLQKFEFPAGSRLDQATAKFKNGLLTVRVPYNPVPRPPARIEIPLSDE
jgi:HSP20 family molecular chaperone IbpA